MSSEEPATPVAVDPSTLEDAEAVIEALRATADPHQKLRMALRLAEFEPDAARPVISMLDATAVDTKQVIELKIGEKTFAPWVAYAIFAADLVRGYEKPKLLIEFDPLSLLPFVHFEAEKKVDAEAPDAVALVRDFLPADTIYEDRNLWEERRKEEQAKLPFLSGDVLFDVNEEFSVRRVKFSAETASYLRRMVVFSWFFIEGARVPDESDSTWDFYIITENGTNAFAGYTSVYSFMFYSSGAQFEADGRAGRCTRKRIAHFILLPPYQRQGLGFSAYLQLVRFFVRDPLVKEVEVEDPTPDLEMLRDKAHWKWLSADENAVALFEDYTSDPEATLDKLVEQFKLAPVQLQRAAEMYIYTEAGNKETRAFKQLIKSRLWAGNFEALRDMDPATQRERIQDAYEGVLNAHLQALGLREDDSSSEDEEQAEIDGVSDLLESIAAGGSAAITETASAVPPAPKRPRQD